MENNILILKLVDKINELVKLYDYDINKYNIEYDEFVNIMNRVINDSNYITIIDKVLDKTKGKKYSRLHSDIAGFFYDKDNKLSKKIYELSIDSPRSKHALRILF